ncbi:hypothetical protein C8024_00215 [Sphingopyxis sp. BSNA05]|nr:hypothetical protein [Sphingopyxis sp. BSNA05]
MTIARCDNLNEKEKQVLHLLLLGHDAKTAAQEVGVTPNVINERLRSARQKLQVTSSKAAARMLADHEGLAPKFLYPRILGLCKSRIPTQFIPCLDNRQRHRTGSGKCNRLISLIPLCQARCSRCRSASREKLVTI